MDFAILSDIHSNYIALKKCVENALDRGIDHFIFLGDYVADLPYAQETMEYIHKMRSEYACIFIKGNKEDYWLNYRAGRESGWHAENSTTGNLWYSYHKLSRTDMDFFEGLEIAQEVAVDGMEPFTICHGTPECAGENMYTDMHRIREVMMKDRNRLIICGHVHWPMKIEYKGRVLLNAGSVGVPYFQGGNLTQFMILHGSSGTWKEEFVDISYDAEEVIAHIYRSGMYKCAPYWCKVSEYILRHGSADICPATVLNRTMELCRTEEGACDWHNIPEKYWKKAYEELCGSIPDIG